jgi:hypothetical protein
MKHDLPDSLIFRLHQERRHQDNRDNKQYEHGDCPFAVLDDSPETG